MSVEFIVPGYFSKEDLFIDPVYSNSGKTQKLQHYLGPYFEIRDENKKFNKQNENNIACTVTRG